MQDLTRDRELGRQRDLGFTTLDRKDRAVALLDNRHLHQEPFPASPSPSIQGQEGKADQPDVKHQVRPQRQASGGTTQRFTVRCCRIWLYGIKAPPAATRTHAVNRPSGRNHDTARGPGGPCSVAARPDGYHQPGGAWRRTRHDQPAELHVAPRYLTPRRRPTGGSPSPHRS